MRKLTVYGYCACVMGLLAIAVRICHILFFVDNVDCLSEEKSFSYWTFVAIFFAATVLAVVLLFVLKKDDFVKIDEVEFKLGRNFAAAFGIVATLACAGYSVYSGAGFFNSSVAIIVGFLFLSALMCFYYGYVAFAGTDFYKNKTGGAVSIIPIAYYILKVVTVFLYYTNNNRDFNFKEMILTNVLLLLFFTYLGKYISTKKSAKQAYVFGLFAIFAVAVTWLPLILTVRVVPVFETDTALFLLYATADISAALYAFFAIKTYFNDGKAIQK